MQLQVSGGAPPPSSFQIISMIVTWVISVAAFALASYSLYLQRKDRKPQLKLRVETDKRQVYLGKQDKMGFSTTELAEVLIIHAANPTDKQITVERIEFEAKHYLPIEVPVKEGIENIPPHEKREALVVVAQLRAELGVARIGRFIITDALGNQHKSYKVWL